MVDMCREKKTGAAEEYNRSDRKRALQACTAWMRYFTRSQWSSFKSDVTWSRFDFFQDEPCGVVLDLLYARDLFIGNTCKSSIAVVQSWRDLDATSFSVELLDRNGQIDAILLSARNVVRQRLLMCCFIDSVCSRCTPRYSIVWLLQC